MLLQKTLHMSQSLAECKARLEAIASQLSAADKTAAEKAAVAFQPAPVDKAANVPPLAATIMGG